MNIFISHSGKTVGYSLEALVNYARQVVGFGLPQRHREHKDFYSGSVIGGHRLRLVPSYAKEFTEEPPGSI